MATSWNETYLFIMFFNIFFISDNIYFIPSNANVFIVLVNYNDPGCPTDAP